MNTQQRQYLVTTRTTLSTRFIDPVTASPAVCDLAGFANAIGGSLPQEDPAIALSPLAALQATVAAEGSTTSDLRSMIPAGGIIPGIIITDIDATAFRSFNVERLVIQLAIQQFAELPTANYNVAVPAYIINGSLPRFFRPLSLIPFAISISDPVQSELSDLLAPNTDPDYPLLTVMGDGSVVCQLQIVSPLLNAYKSFRAGVQFPSNGPNSGLSAITYLSPTSTSVTGLIQQVSIVASVQASDSVTNAADPLNSNTVWVPTPKVIAVHTPYAATASGRGTSTTLGQEFQQFGQFVDNTYFPVANLSYVTQASQGTQDSTNFSGSVLIPYAIATSLFVSSDPAQTVTTGIEVFDVPPVIILVPDVSGPI